MPFLPKGQIVQLHYDNLDQLDTSNPHNGNYTGVMGAVDGTYFEFRCGLNPSFPWNVWINGTTQTKFDQFVCKGNAYLTDQIYRDE